MLNENKKILSDIRNKIYKFNVLRILDKDTVIILCECNFFILSFLYFFFSIFNFLINDIRTESINRDIT